jgi:hypothetical protein
MSIKAYCCRRQHTILDIKYCVPAFTCAQSLWPSYVQSIEISIRVFSVCQLFAPGYEAGLSVCLSVSSSSPGPSSGGPHSGSGCVRLGQAVEQLIVIGSFALKECCGWEGNAG